MLRSTVHDAHVLELACGTGLWTRRFAENNAHVDSRRCVARSHRHQPGTRGHPPTSSTSPPIFSGRVPPANFDVVFFSFWLSHVPPARFEEFWAIVKAALKPGGQAFFVDGLMEQTSSAKDHGPLDESGISRRRLNDGERVRDRENLLSAARAGAVPR